MQKPLDERVLVTREGGAVRRCHILGNLMGDVYNNASHSYNAVSLLLLLYPAVEGVDPSMRLVKALLWHDAAERFVGDAPATAKWKDAKFQEIYERIEADYLAEYGLAQELVDREKAWLNWMDKLELMLWAIEQVARGNSPIYRVVERLQSWFNGQFYSGTMDFPRVLETYIREHAWEPAHFKRLED